MKKILCFLSRNDYMALEAVVDNAKAGDEVMFIGCDNTIGICHENNSASSTRCFICKRRMYKKVVEMRKNNPQIHIFYTTIKNEVSDDMIKHADTSSFDYKDVCDIKAIQYKGVSIGYAAFSDFVSCTRNIIPTFNDYFHNYIDYNLRKGMVLTDVVDNILGREKYDLVIFHNGRFVNVKPFYDLAKNNHIDYIATEITGEHEGWRKKNNFYNGIPHSVMDRRRKMEKAWVKASDEGERIGRSFFEKRYNGILAGDRKVYTKEQVAGMLPDGFDPQKRNIAIFNSSEDEFMSISKEIDEGMLFNTQFEALKNIFEHYQNDMNIHFYLRIHPNLVDVPFRSHTALYKLDYPNVTIIPPKSPISSYSLMENVDKVIVFNSTMGVESAYWGKPVIGLNHCVYDFLWHMPNSVEELYDMIDDPSLKCIQDKSGCYKIACYLMGCHGDSFHHYPTCYRKSKRFLGREWYTLSQFKLFGSPMLATAVEQLMCHVGRKIFHDVKFPEDIAEMTK